MAHHQPIDGWNRSERRPRLRHALRSVRAWRGFTPPELLELLELTRRWDLAKGTLVCAENGPGGSCFIVVRGAVDVSTEVRGQQRRLARLGPGSIFGQISLIDGEPRSATCSAQSRSRSPAPVCWSRARGPP